VVVLLASAARRGRRATGRSGSAEARPRYRQRIRIAGEGEALVARPFAITLEEFGRAVDELFDDLVLGPWRLAGEAEAEHAIVRDFGDRYEVRIAIGEADPARVEVEVSERRLTVRIPDGVCGVSEGAFSFSEPIDSDAVTAKVSDATLVVVLPKKGVRHRVRWSRS
jgi:HSP20 family molecular chaperone IbpA